MTPKSTFLRVVLLVGVFASPGTAATVEYVWEAEIATLNFQMGARLDAGVSEGDTISGTWTYHTPVNDFDPDPNKIVSIDTLMSLTAEIGTLTAAFTSSVSPSFPNSSGISTYNLDNDDDIGAASGFIGALFDNDVNDALDDDRNLPAAVPILLNGTEANGGVAEARFEITALQPGFFGSDLLLNETIDIAETFNAFLDITLTETPNGSNALGFRSNLTMMRLASDPPPPPPPPDPPPPEGPSPVPLPAGLWLLLSALGPLIVAGRRRR